MTMLQVYTDFIEDIEPLSDEQVGRLFRAMLRYADDDEYDPQFTGEERISWATAKKTLKRQWLEYRKMCQRNKENISKRYDPLRQDTTRNDTLRQDTSGNNKIKENKIKENIYISKEKDIERENATERVKRMLEAM